MLQEITSDDLRILYQRIVKRNTLATTIHARDIVKQIYVYAILHDERVTNPAAPPALIATFIPHERALSPTEIRIMLRIMEKVPTLPTVRLGSRFLLLTMVRKSELQMPHGTKFIFQICFGLSSKKE